MQPRSSTGWTTVLGAPSQANVVGLAAGEILQCRPPASSLHHPQVDLQALMGAHRGLGRAAQQHLIHLWLHAKALHHCLAHLSRVCRTNPKLVDLIADPDLQRTVRDMLEASTVR